jgi:hypothetical protein
VTLCLSRQQYLEFVFDHTVATWLSVAFGALGPSAVTYLGTVKNLAQVRLNEEDLGIVWTAPWRVNVGKHCASG